nr:GNAT family N-acetyltransferase [uncultured Desulfobulbus sp.]
MNAVPFGTQCAIVAPFTLIRLKPVEAEPIAHRLAAMDPWKRLHYGATTLGRYLSAPDPSLNRFILQEGEESIAIVCIRFPWLRGPYLELLAVFPPAQSRGVGRALLGWMEQEAGPGVKNLWTVTSEFNTRARKFYRAAGFFEVAPLPDLVQNGTSELLLRKQITCPS